VTFRGRQHPRDIEAGGGVYANSTALLADAPDLDTIRHATAIAGGLTDLAACRDGAPRPVAVAENDTIREELEEFVDCVRGRAKPETDGWWASRSWWSAAEWCTSK